LSITQPDRGIRVMIRALSAHRRPLGFSLLALAAATAGATGVAKRAPNPAFADYVGMQNISVEWSGTPVPPTRAAAGFLETEFVRPDGTVELYGWLFAGNSPLRIEVAGGAAVVDAAGIEFLREDIEVSKGARAFWVVFRRLTGRTTPICVVAIVDGERQLLPSKSCPGWPP
jgi:hypothetical protein